MGTPSDAICVMRPGDTSRWAARDADRPRSASSQVLRFMAQEFSHDETLRQALAKPCSHILEKNMRDAHRKARLAHLIAADYGSRAAFLSANQWISKSRLSQAAGRHEPFGEDAANLWEEKLGLDKGWFSNTWPTPKEKRTGETTGTSVIKSHQDDENRGFKILQFDTGGSMGHGVVLRDQPGVIQSWTVSDSWIQQNVHRVTSAKNLCIVTGFGPSMQPLFNPGDPLLVDRGVTNVDVDSIYFFRVGQEGFVKQLQRIPTADGLILRAKSYNALYDSFDIVDGMDFEVFGRVVKTWKGEEF